MTNEIKTGPKPGTERRGATFANVCLMLLVGCCLCASLAASLF
ncbi:MAG: hypothetical protein JWR59_946 [Brevundimonas sp.]|nr:hypothetical protein [Brevundimonas sp.]